MCTNVCLKSSRNVNDMGKVTIFSEVIVILKMEILGKHAKDPLDNRALFS